jgi:calpain-9
VLCRCQLEAGAYLVMPTTFEPREEANFSLRVFSNKPLKMKVLDYIPQMVKPALIKAPPGVETSSFSQYEAVFLQLSDEHRTIDAFELQELLDACLPNDYIKSCASIDTCRQIVLSMDVSFLNYIHTYHSRLIPKGVADISDIPPRCPRLTKMT